LKKAGDIFQRAITKVFCTKIPAASLPFDVKVEQPVNDCGDEINAKKGSCSNLAAKLGGAISRIDVVLDTVPVEIKLGRSYRTPQLVRFCRAGAKYGTHVLLYFMGNWPPQSQEKDKAGKPIGKQLYGARRCYDCWSSSILSSAGCKKTAFGSIVIFLGWDRSAKKFRMGFPSAKDLGC
jgi:hypothetical protein